MELSQVYQQLLTDNTSCFFQGFNGVLVTPEEFALSDSYYSLNKLNVYSGSFNPLHDGHKAIYESMPNWPYGVKVFELSINRSDKAPLSLEDMETRLKQFVCYAPVLITNVSKFVEKAGLLRRFEDGITFYVGADTFKRILRDHSVPEIQGMNCEFVIYNRIVEGNSVMELPKNLPVNCRYGIQLSENLMKLSSTSIRNGRTVP